MRQTPNCFHKNHNHHHKKPQSPTTMAKRKLVSLITKSNKKRKESKHMFTHTSDTRVGDRPYNEDRVAIHTKDEYILYEVYDGHGDDSVSEWLSNFLGERFLAHVTNHNDTKTAITELFVDIDKQIYQELFDENSGKSPGSTATLAFVNKKTGKLYVINLGDSKTIVIKSCKKVVLETKLHKTCSSKERNRVIKSGGYIYSRGYVSIVPETSNEEFKPRLAMTRAFGDVWWKKDKTNNFSPTDGPVCAIPQIQEYDLDPNKNYKIVLGTDGLWDYLDNKRVIELCQKNEDAQNLASYLLDECEKATRKMRTKRDSMHRMSDNLSVIVVNIDST
jgi:serine/threonine protein phosphatase PrpC